LASRSLPKNASLVHGFLRRQDGPVSAYQVLDGLRDAGINAPPTVYRALDQLVARGLAHRVESLNAFVACSHPEHDEESGFAICTDCGSVTEFSGAAVLKALDDIARRQDFALDRTTIELSGQCSSCRFSGTGDDARST
tara:strand:+ start:1937 stop:2353 length:417 start_codon:yes stop_codon:yes gene_type:complete